MYSLIAVRVRKILSAWKSNDPNAVEFYEPLKDKTLKHKRALLIAAISIIVIKTLGIEVDSILGVKFTKITDVSEIAGIIFWIVLYELITFVLSFWADIKSWNFKRSIFKYEEIIKANETLTYQIWKITQSLNVHYKDISELRALSRSEQTSQTSQTSQSLQSLLTSQSLLSSKMLYVANSLDNTVKGIQFDPETKLSLDESIKKFMTLLSEIESTKKILQVKNIITYLMDFLIPILLSTFSIYLSYTDGFSIICRVFS